MGADQNFDWLKSAASTLDWWAEAGVDLIVEDMPRDWLAPPVKPVAQPSPAPSTPTPTPATLPDTLEAFTAWRSSDTAPEASWRGDFMLGGGPAGAAIAVVVDCPDTDDAAGGGLLTGAAGKLFDRMLAAIDLTRADILLIPVCGKRPLGGRVPAEVEARLQEIARHHLSLATPRRILTLGKAASRAIIGTEAPDKRGILHSFNHKSGDIGVIASLHPRLLLAQPAQKAEAWRDLQLLTGDLS